MFGFFYAFNLALLYIHIVLQSRMTSLQPFFQRSSIPFGHGMSRVRGMNQFGVMNEDVVEEVNLGIDDCVMKREDDFRNGNENLVSELDELEAGDFTAATA